MSANNAPMKQDSENLVLRTRSFIESVLLERVSRLATFVFSERLGDLLKARNLTQRDLGDRIGMSDVTVSRYVSGARIPNAFTIAKMAEALDVSTDYLLGVDKSKDNTMQGLWDRVTQIFERQTQKGIAEYGQSLIENKEMTILQLLVMALEENVDASIYTQRAIDLIKEGGLNELLSVSRKVD